MERHLDALAQQLGESGGPWITGGQLTLADVSWAVVLERLREADWVAELVVPRPQVAAYWQRLRARPGYVSAMDEHQHPLVRRGTERIVAEKARGGALAELYAATGT